MIHKSIEKPSFLVKLIQFYQKRSSKNTKIQTSRKTNPLAADNQNEIIF